MVNEMFGKQKLSKERLGNKVYSNKNNISWLLVDRIFRLITAFFIGVWVARYLGPENYGIVSLALSMVGIIGAIVSLGFVSYIVKELVTNHNKESEILGTVFYSRLITGFLFFIIINFFFYYYETTQTIQYVSFIISFLLITQAFDIFELYFQAKSENKYSVISRLIATLVTSILKIGFIIFNLNIYFIAVTFVLEYVVMAIISFIIYRKTRRVNGKWLFKIKLFKKYFKDTLPLIFASLSVVIYLKIDQIMLGYLEDATAVGVYAVAVRLSEVWYFIPGVIITALYPSLIKLRQNNSPRYNKEIQKILNLFALINIALIVFIILFSKPIILFLYGTSFEVAHSILQVHIIASLFVFMRVLLSNWLINEKLYNFQFICDFSGAIINIILNYYFISKYGGIGAAYSTLISYFVATMLITLLYKRTRNLSLMMFKSLYLWIFFIPLKFKK